MFVSQFKETHQPPPPRVLLSEKLPWGSFVDDERRIMRTRDDGYFAGFSLHGYDLESLAESDLEVLMHGINEAFMRLPPSWGGWLETRRGPESPLMPGKFPDPVSQYLEDEHCEGLNARGLYDTRAYLFVWQRPEVADDSKLQQFMFTPAARDPNGRALQLFDEHLQSWISFLKGSCEALVPLLDDDFLSVMYEPLLSPPRHILTPTPPTHLNTLAEVGIWPAIDPQIGPNVRDRQYIGCLSIDHDFPPQTAMGLWRGLWRVPVPFRWMTRCLPVDTSGAKQHLDKNQDDFETSRMRLGDLFWSVMRRDSTPREDAHVERQKSEVDHTRDLMLSNRFKLHDLTMTLVCTHADLGTLDEMLMKVAKPIQDSGCTVRRETYNTYEAFLSTLAGLPYVNTRKLRMTTFNLATLGPFHAPYQGPKDTPHLKGPVLTHGVTSSCMLARVSPYEDDCADQLVVGPKGSGKSTLMAWRDFCQGLRFKGWSVMGWSKGGSFRCVAKCLGGVHYNLYHDDLGIQIFRDLHRDEEVPWILSFLYGLLRAREMVIDAEVQSIVSSNVQALRNSLMPRTLRSLIVLLAGHRRHLEQFAMAQKRSDLDVLSKTVHRIVTVFKNFAQGGVYGRYFDADQDTFQLSRVMSLDPGELIQVAEVYPSVLNVIFHRVRQRRDGFPTRYDFDEAHQILDTPSFVDFLAVDIPDWRRENSSGCFGTQALAQLKGTKISSLMFESSVVRSFLPNSHAMEEDSLKAYQAMELHRDEIEAHIANGTAKCDVYEVRPDGRRRINERLFPVARDICGANTIPAHHLMDQVELEYESSRFAVGWLRTCGHDRAAAVIDQAIREREDEDVSMPVASALSAAN